MSRFGGKLPKIAAGAVLAVDLLLVLALATRLPDTILVDNAIDLWFDQSDPVIDVFEREKALFERESWMIANVWSRDADAATLEAISANLTSALRRVDGVGDVLSPHALDVLQSDPEGLFYDRLPSGLTWPERRAELRRHPIANNLLVHDDPTVISFIIKESTETGQRDLVRQRLVDGIRAALHEEPRIERAAVVGAAVINAEMNRLSWRDFVILIPASSVVIVLLLVLLLRASWRFGLGIVLSSSAATLATCSLMLLCGAAFNMLTIALPGVVFTLAVASSLHVLHHYLGTRESAESSPSRHAWTTTRQLLRPIAVSHVTTALGFGMMIVMPVLPVDTMALYGAAGVLWAGVHSALVAPQLLAWLGPAATTGATATKAMPAPFRGVQAIAVWIRGVASGYSALRRRRGFVALAVTAGTAATVALVVTLRVDSTYLNMVAEDEVLRRDYATFAESDLASAQLSVLVSRPSPDALVAVDLNAAVAEASARIESLEAVRKVIGPAAIFDEVAPKLADDQTLSHFSADALAVTDAYIFALTGGNQEVSRYVGDSLENFRLVVLFDYLSNSALQSLANEEIRAILADTVGRVHGADFDMSGLALLWSNLDGAILRGQLVSLFVIGAVCFAVFFLSTRRLRLSLIATFVNFMPMAAIAAIMAASGLTLDLAAIFVLGLTLGIAIDDTSFFVHRYDRRRSPEAPLENPDVDPAIDDALRETAPPMLVTSLIIAAGFSVLFLSAFVPMRVFGGFTAMGVVFAALFDCFVLPLLLNLYDQPRETAQCAVTSPA